MCPPSPSLVPRFGMDLKAALATCGEGGGGSKVSDAAKSPNYQVCRVGGSGPI